MPKPIITELKTYFGDRAKTIRVELRHRKEINRFIQMIEKAHQEAGKSELRFKGD